MRDLSQEMTPLFDAVKKYVDDKVVQFHVPGHKHGRGIKELREYIGSKALQMDANGMEDLDYLNNPTGVIMKSQKLLADAFRADYAFFLVNGTTSGVQSMIMSACSPGDKIILPRNSHKSTIGGIILSGAIPVYLQPEINDKLGIAAGVTLEKVQQAIHDNPDAKAILLVNPTYYGFASDINSIVMEAHKHGIAVLVDEAHGAHMAFHKQFPLTAMDAGADMSAVSMHKTGGSMTQSSVLLLKGNLIDSGKVRQVLNLTYTTSASYLLMCSIDVARKQLASNGKEMLDKVLALSRWGRKEINKIEGLYAFGKELVGTPGCFDFDESKLSINVKGTGLTGCEIESLLRRDYNIQIELSDPFNILAIISLGDIKKDIGLLIRALGDISLKFNTAPMKNIPHVPQNPPIIMPPHKAFYSSKRSVLLKESIGEVAGEMVMAYPPGIPIVCMGEQITPEIVEYINMLKEEKCTLHGTEDPKVNYIRVLTNK